MCRWPRASSTSRRRLSIILETSFSIKAVEQALKKHGKPEIFNSPGEGRGQGSQVTAQAFTQVLRDQDIAISMDGRGA